MPVPKLADVLKQSGWTQEQIDALDAKALSGFNGVLTAAEAVEQDALKKQQEAVAAATRAEADRKAAEESVVAAKTAQEAAELQKRSVDQFWNETYNPGMQAAEKEKQRLAQLAAASAAEAAYYKEQRKTYLDALGIKPEDAPEFKAANPEPVKVTPGTPVLVDPNQIVSRATDGINTILNIDWKYRTLYNGQPLPMSPTELIAQADRLKLTPDQFAERTFKFSEKEAERVTAARKAEVDAATAAAVALKDTEHKAEMERVHNEHNAKLKTLAETTGSGANPDLRQAPGSAKFADLQRATKAGERPDPTRMSIEQRRALTSANIHKAIEERQAATV